MAAKKRSIRVRGLVKAMNQVRDRLRTGIPAAGEADFRRQVRGLIESVDRLCRAHRATPSDLPTPSRMAYEFLRAIDLDDLPRPTVDRIVAEGSVRIPGIIATCNRYHVRLRTLAHSSETHDDRRAKIAGFVRELRADAAGIEATCRSAGASPEALPVPSRRAYCWLAYLGSSDSLSRHLDALTSLKIEARRARRVPTAQFRLFNTPMLYRSTLKESVYDVLVHEGFVGAPPGVLAALARLAVGKPEYAYTDLVRDYGASDPFATVRTALVSQVQGLKGEGRGVWHDLDAAFTRVNLRSLDGQLSKPRLVWSRLMSSRKLAHYDAVQDVVMVNVALDREDVPPYVVDSIVHHELLHKAMGTEVVNGRRHIHTPAFRRAEQSFPRYEEAQRFLQQLTGGSST